jgi:hypothetical protein
MHRLWITIILAAVISGALAVPATAAPLPASESATPGPLAIETILARRILPSGYFKPRHIGGDKEFDGHGPKVSATAELIVNSSSLSVRLFMDAVETKSDFTQARGYLPDYLIYRSPAGQCIAGVSRGTYDKIQYEDTDHTVDHFLGQVAGSFVSDYWLVGDTVGDDAGVATGMAIRTYTFTVTTRAC